MRRASSEPDRRSLLPSVAGTAPEDQVPPFPVYLLHPALTNWATKRHEAVPEIEDDTEAGHSSYKRRQADMRPNRFLATPVVEYSTQPAPGSTSQNGKGQLQ